MKLWGDKEPFEPLGEEMKSPDVDKLFTTNKTLASIGIALVFGAYARITGDTQPLAIFVIVVAAVFMFQTLNYVMGKLGQ